MKTILGVKLDNRLEDAVEFQKAITDFGCIIRSRIGLHQQENDSCSREGYILLELTSDCGESGQKLEKRLNNIENITLKKMEF